MQVIHLSTSRDEPVAVHAFFCFSSLWLAVTKAPVAARVAERTYRRACGQLRRQLEAELGQPVHLIEHIVHPDDVRGRIAGFRDMRAERDRLEAALRAEARQLVTLMRPQLAMTLIARELGVTNSELQYLVTPAKESDNLAFTPADAEWPDTAHAEPRQVAQT